MEINGLKLGRYTELQVSNGASHFEEMKNPDETKKIPNEINTLKKRTNPAAFSELSDPPQKNPKLEDATPVSNKITTPRIATSPCHYKYLCRGQRYFNSQF
jgi:hypothetical protein